MLRVDPETVGKKEQDKEGPIEVKITGIDIDLSNWVIVLVKVALAAVPAALVIALFYWVFASFFYAVLRGV